MSAAKRSKSDAGGEIARGPSAEGVDAPSEPSATGDPALDFGPLEYLLGYRLRKVYSVLFRTFSELFQDLNLAFGQYSILLLVKHNPGESQMTIADAAGLDRSTLVPILHKFVRLGWVRRTRRRSDRRHYSLRLTPAGESVLKAAEPVIAAHEEQLFAPLSGAERQTLDVLLSKIIEADRKLQQERSGAEGEWAGD